MVHVFLTLQNGRSIFSGWNNCTPQSSSAVRASRPQAKPALALAHHKTGTFFALAVGSVFCSGRCCVRLMNHGDAVWPLRSVAQPELVLSVFGHGVQLGPSDVQNFRRIVHFVRSPQQVVTSAVRYHAAGHENFCLLLTLDVAPNGSTWSVVAGKQGTVYCASETSSPDVVRLIRTGVGLLKRSSTVKHAGLLRSLHAKQQLQFEAAWNWCELSNMLRIAESLCAHAHAVQLDVSRSSGRSGAAGSGLALNLTGLARQLTPRPDSRTAGWQKRAPSCKNPRCSRPTRVVQVQVQVRALPSLARTEGLQACTRGSRRVTLRCEGAHLGVSGVMILATVAVVGLLRPRASPN